jgi:hypothetical protein
VATLKTSTSERLRTNHEYIVFHTACCGWIQCHSRHRLCVNNPSLHVENYAIGMAPLLTSSSWKWASSTAAAMSNQSEMQKRVLYQICHNTHRLLEAEFQGNHRLRMSPRHHFVRLNPSASMRAVRMRADCQQTSSIFCTNRGRMILRRSHPDTVMISLAVDTELVFWSLFLSPDHGPWIRTHVYTCNEM